MEDQQSASGDLTQKSVANGESTDTASAATEGHRGEIDAAGEPDERGAAVADSQADEMIRPRRLPGAARHGQDDRVAGG